ncbi:hypothetical protein HWV62_5115 [Athelia sp. TMB]|nr:hypothetical protein HWV62_5115 [Athelia sp. TMB]
MLFSRTTLASALATVALFWSTASAQNLTNDEVALVQARLANGARTSWEFGTRTQAILELNAPDYSVTSNHSLPPSNSVNASEADSLAAVFQIAHDIVLNRTISNGNITGPQPLINDSSAGDPASIGMAVLLASWTQQYLGDGLDYSGAATDQLNYLFDVVPHTEDGAISHVVKEVELWADSVYMVPPFLAYYGMIYQNQSVLYEAYNQISLYRSYLRDNSTIGGGLWRHVLMGDNQDVGHWSTGNAWAAAGMLRVLGTIRNSQYNSSMLNEQQDLINWISEIHNGMYTNMDANFIFRNYADQPLSATNFYDASSTALLASTVYRLALFTNVTTYIPYAEKSRLVLGTPAPASSSSSAPADSSSLSSSSSSVPSVTAIPASASHASASSSASSGAKKANKHRKRASSSSKSSSSSSSSSSSKSSSSSASGSGSSSKAGSTSTLVVAPTTTPILSTTVITIGTSHITSVITETPAATIPPVITPPVPTPTPTFCALSQLNLTAMPTTTVSISAVGNSTLSLNATATATQSLGPSGCIIPPIITYTTTYTSPAPPQPTVTDAPGTLAHFTQDGWLTPVVDPYEYQYQGNESPEAQAFVMLMQAAYRDWVAAVAEGQNATATHKSGALRNVVVGGAGQGWMTALFLGVGVCLHWTLF